LGERRNELPVAAKVRNAVTGSAGRAVPDTAAQLPMAVFADGALAAIAQASQISDALRNKRPDNAEALVRVLVGSGLPTACVEPERGGLGLATDPARVLILMEVLRAVGRGDLSAGRLLEAHVNAVRLVHLFGTTAQRAWVAGLVSRGGMLGVWAADAPQRSVQIANMEGEMLVGAKAYCSGAGAIHGALVTAGPADAPRLILIGRISAARIDLTRWNATGMRATNSAVVCLDGIPIDPHALVGQPGDYRREPHFSGGLWRILAVQVGGIECIVEAFRQHLRATGRCASPVQRARLADTATAAETARLWVQQTALLVEDADVDPQLAITHLALAREAVLRGATTAMELAQRGVGLAAMMADHPLERATRDLATLLRQPDPDGARDRAAGVLCDQPRPIGEMWT
jgi:alkylation response protein AidB-like acyl-CoA dehydrogenase